MTHSSIRAFLPFLRRYARALTGSQRDGDGLVAATLRDLIDHPAAQSPAPLTRVGLYQLFTRRSMGQPLARRATEVDTADAAQMRLSALSPEARQALLLTTIEGFDMSEAAEILGRSLEQTGELVLHARAAIAAQSHGRVLIIEDEALIAMDLGAIVGSLGHTIVGTAATADQAVQAAAAQAPNLVLADVQLAQGTSGITAVRDILSKVSIPVIFITAFPESLLTGERPEPTFLIAKPYAEETVRAMISQVLFFGSTPAHGYAAPEGSRAANTKLMA